MKLPKISSAFLNLTDACNLACRYCFVKQRPNFMALETAKDAADFLAGNADGTLPSINYFGGEPLICWESVIVPLTEYIRERYGANFALSMTSNCVLMDREKLEFMREKGVGLLFSIDGDRATQDWNRPLQNGGSSFDVLEGKIPLILSYFPNVTFRSTVTPHTAGELFGNMLFAERAGFRNFFTIPNCFEEWDDCAVELLRKNLRNYSDHYIECMRMGIVPVIFSEIEKNFRKILLRNAAIERGDRRGHPSCRACGKCGLGAMRFGAVNINGDIVSCQEFFSHDSNRFVIGNIYTGVDDATRMRLMEEFDGKRAEGDQCETCALDRICDGGCVANNYFGSGDIHKVAPVMCAWSRMLFDEAVYIMQTLGGEENALFRKRWKDAV